MSGKTRLEDTTFGEKALDVKGRGYLENRSTGENALTVAETGSSPSATATLHVENTGNTSALEVNSITRLGNTAAGHTAVAVTGASTFAAQAGQTLETMTVDGITKFQRHAAGELSLHVFGQAKFERLGPDNDPLSATVDGNIKLQKDGTHCGTIVPVLLQPSGSQLEINTQDGDPSVIIGTTGNSTKLSSDHNWIGRTAGEYYRTAIRGPVDVDDGEINVHDAILADNLKSSDIDSRNAGETLSVGTLQAAAVSIGRAGHDTQVNGTLHVSEQAHLTGGVAGPFSVDGTVVANGMNLSGSAIVSNTVVAAALDVNGNGDVSGVLQAGTLTATAVSADKGTIAGNSDDSTALSVSQSSDHATQPAMDVLCENSNQPAIRATGETALDANGVVRMNLNSIILGGSGDTEVAVRSNPDGKIIEFLVGGIVTFYIDQDGGHNA